MKFLQFFRWYGLHGIKRRIDAFGAERHFCGRRHESWQGETKEKAPDYWYKRDDALVCSYCGGLKPSECIRLVEIAEDLESTTKGYKRYLHVGAHQYKIYTAHFFDLDDIKKGDGLEAWKRMYAIAEERDIVNAWQKRVPHLNTPAATDSK